MTIPSYPHIPRFARQCSRCRAPRLCLPRSAWEGRYRGRDPSNLGIPAIFSVGRPAGRRSRSLKRCPTPYERTRSGLPGKVLDLLWVWQHHRVFGYLRRWYVRERPVPKRWLLVIAIKVEVHSKHNARPSKRAAHVRYLVRLSRYQKTWRPCGLLTALHRPLAPYAGAN